MMPAQLGFLSTGAFDLSSVVDAWAESTYAASAVLVQSECLLGLASCACM